MWLEKHVFSNGKHGLSLADEAWANEEVRMVLKKWDEYV